jgi:hypothetical protein
MRYYLNMEKAHLDVLIDGKLVSSRQTLSQAFLL